MNQKIESVDYYDVMPLIDEYIDIVFDNKQRTTEGNIRIIISCFH